jgi:hypothetical protein
MLDRCPDCGSSRTGLPEEGRCPECGFDYRQEILVLYGFRSHDPKEMRFETRLRVLEWLAVVYLAIIAISVAVTSKYDGVVFMLISTAPLARHYWTLKRAMKENLPGPLQLRVGPCGYAMRTGIGKVRTTPWPRDMGGAWELRMTRNQRTGRFRFALQRRGWKLVLRQPILIELAMPERDAQHLHDQILRWAMDGASARQAVTQNPPPLTQTG